MIKLKKEGENLMGYNEDNVACCYYPINSEAKELDLLLLPNPFEEDFWETVPVKWVKWNKKKPHWNGAVWLQFNGKNQGRGIVHNGNLISLEGDKVSEEFIRDYQDTFYWLLQETDKAAQSKVQYSLEDIKKAVGMARTLFEENMFDIEEILGLTEVSTHNMILKYSEEEIIQSLSTQQLPKEFKPIMVCSRCLKPDDNDEDCWSAKECSRNTDFPDTFKTIANSEGKEKLIGTYKY